MYMFFAIFGFIFIFSISLIINYIYDFFSINKVTTFFKPLEKSIYNDINICVLPIIIWSIIMTPLLGNNLLFLLSIIINIITNCSIIFIIKNVVRILKKDINEDDITFNFITIIISTIFGVLTNLILLKLGNNYSFNIVISSFGMIILLVLYIYLKYNPPKNKFFKIK